ncbi:MAG: hypothetical protein C4524_02265 [Candidatus Zixiibacteriota bacterium]|nr:MAG: hypothetical protein C4524_02265 [candidate division Zixibacteria bacterium]
MKTIILILSFCLFAGACHAQSGSVKTLQSTPTNSPVIDGDLEALWWSVAPESGFTQYNPQEGAAPSQKTEVRVMHSPSALYLAFRCYDGDPGAILSPLTKHDRLGDCDQVSLYLDPYHDHRTGYFFSTNPRGVMQEGIMYNDIILDMSWDGSWEAAAVQDDSGWTAEMRIPFSSLRFTSDPGAQVWGINLQRYIFRDKESNYWQPVTRALGRRVSSWGHLEGLSGLQPGRGLELTPYAVADFTEDPSGPLHGENGWDNLGLDVKYRLAPSLTLDATVNPDFAQIEADDEVVNLSSYPVYLQEKRPFFLEGGSIFNSPVQLFYSRRITNPELGGKISGKIGSVKLAALVARNLNQADQREDFGILRLKRDVLEKSEVGILLTGMQGADGYFNRVWSADTRLRLGNPWDIDALIGQSFRPGISRNNFTHRLGIGWYTAAHTVEALFTGSGRDFDANDAGFVGYSDNQKGMAHYQLTLRPETWGVRRIIWDVGTHGETLYDLSLPQSAVNASVNVQTMNYLYYNLSWNHRFDQYLRRYNWSGQPASYYDNFGPYEMAHYQDLNTYSANVQTDGARPLSGGFGYELGDFRGGYLRSWNGSIQARPKSNLTLQVVGDYSRVTGSPDFNGGAATDFIVGRFKTEWTLSTRLFTRMNLQYIHGDEIYLTNALLGYNFAPRSWFYLVYDDQKQDLLGWDSITHRKIKVKLSYFLHV